MLPTLTCTLMPIPHALPASSLLRPVPLPYHLPWYSPAAIRCSCWDQPWRLLLTMHFSHFPVAVTQWVLQHCIPAGLHTCKALCWTACHQHQPVLAVVVVGFQWTCRRAGCVRQPMDHRTVSLTHTFTQCSLLASSSATTLWERASIVSLRRVMQLTRTDVVMTLVWMMWVIHQSLWSFTTLSVTLSTWLSTPTSRVTQQLCNGDHQLVLIESFHLFICFEYIDITDWWHWTIFGCWICVR